MQLTDLSEHCKKGLLKKLDKMYTQCHTKRALSQFFKPRAHNAFLRNVFDAVDGNGQNQRFQINFVVLIQNLGLREKADTALKQTTVNRSAVNETYKQKLLLDIHKA